MTLVSLLMPKLEAATVKVTLLPTTGVELLTVLTTFKSEHPLNVVVATAEETKP